MPMMNVNGGRKRWGAERISALPVAAVLIFAALPAAARGGETGGRGGSGGAGAGGEGIVLATQSLWRAFFVWREELVRWESGEPTAVRPGGKGGPAIQKAEAMPAPTAFPPAGWADPSFDDSGWVPTPGPILHAPFRRDLAAMFLRGKFLVADPAAAGALRLSLEFRGGAVVFLNGVEVARAHLPAGPLGPDALAEDYPKEAYVGADGSLLAPDPKGGEPEGAKLRLRKLSRDIPAPALRKGVNVLAVEIRRAPTAEALYTAKSGEKRPWWTMCGFHSLELKAAGAGVSGEAAAPGRPALTPGNPLVESFSTDPAEPAEAARPVRIAGARNGAFSGVLLARFAGSARGLKVEPSDLKSDGGGTIPASAIRVRFAAVGDAPPPGSAGRRKPGAACLGALLESPPAEIAPPAGSGAGTLPVWLTVSVPTGAKAGLYRGSVAILADGLARVEAPMELSVADFVLPDPKDFASYAGLIESPESVALQYNVPLWSEAHWKHLDRVFSYLGSVGNKILFIPLIGQTNLGNMHTMVRWIRKPDGSWDHDFSVAEKYLDIAVRHCGKIPVIVLDVWTATHGGGGFGKVEERGKNDKPMVFTELDPATGEMKISQGPDWGSPESRAFWKPVLEGMLKRLAERGLEKSAALGTACDRVPSKQAFDDLEAAAPGLPWVIHAHGYTTSLNGRRCREAASVWGIKEPRLLSEPNYSPGWKKDIFSPVFPRYGAGSMGHVRQDSPIGVFHALTEAYQASGYSGLGRAGADFWPVVGAGRAGANKGGSSVISRVPTWDRPGPPTMTNHMFLFPAADGAVATVRFELLRMGIQEVEARIFLEKMLLDKDKRAAMGDDLAGRARSLLDERTIWIRRAKLDTSVMYSVGTDASWLGYAQVAPDLARRLFETAAEAAKKLGAQR
ncbi:MAG: hypothetical protein N3A38_10090 [Planctomycetota bacterium]|nr:hypothetical protein [Planctomycetota bacterium]